MVAAAPLNHEASVTEVQVDSVNVILLNKTSEGEKQHENESLSSDMGVELKSLQIRISVMAEERKDSCSMRPEDATAK